MKKNLKNIVINLAEDIRDIAFCRNQLAEGSHVVLTNERNAKRLVEACDRIQFELEMSLERYLDD